MHRQYFKKCFDNYFKCWDLKKKGKLDKEIAKRVFPEDYKLEAKVKQDKKMSEEQEREEQKKFDKKLNKQDSDERRVSRYIRQANKIIKIIRKAYQIS